MQPVLVLVLVAVVLMVLVIVALSMRAAMGRPEPGRRRGEPDWPDTPSPHVYDPDEVFAEGRRESGRQRSRTEPASPRSTPRSHAASKPQAAKQSRGKRGVDEWGDTDDYDASFWKKIAGDDPPFRGASRSRARLSDQLENEDRAGLADTMADTASDIPANPARPTPEPARASDTERPDPGLAALTSLSSDAFPQVPAHPAVERGSAQPAVEREFPQPAVERAEAKTIDPLSDPSFSVRASSTSESRNLSDWRDSLLSGTPLASGGSYDYQAYPEAASYSASDYAHDSSGNYSGSPHPTPPSSTPSYGSGLGESGSPPVPPDDGGWHASPATRPTEVPSWLAGDDYGAPVNGRHASPPRDPAEHGGYPDDSHSYAQPAYERDLWTNENDPYRDYYR